MNIRIVERLLDQYRPGWRERRSKKKSIWNFVCIFVGLALSLLAWFYLFELAWRLHIGFYPSHDGMINEFWGNGISVRAFISSFFMVMPLFIPAMTLGFLISNVIFWLIPPARRVMEREAGNDKSMTFASSNADLIKWGGIASAICFILSFIGLVTLSSLQ